tara:strand:+ start:96 stop:305 length:210 start_codon:yes stop_codon:yes gene_type:complete
MTQTDKEKIEKTLEIIKSTQYFQEIQKLEWEKDKDATEQVFQGLWDSDANKFVNTYFEAQKIFLDSTRI